MKDSILNYIVAKRKGMYCHALEISELHELKNIIEELTSEFDSMDYSKEEIKDFFYSISIYYIGEDEREEEKIYSFRIDQYIEEELF